MSSFVRLASSTLPFHRMCDHLQIHHRPDFAPYVGDFLVIDANECSYLSESALTSHYSLRTPSRQEFDWEGEHALVLSFTLITGQVIELDLGQFNVEGEGRFSTADFFSVTPTLTHLWTSNAGGESIEIAAIDSRNFMMSWSTSRYMGAATVCRLHLQKK